MGLYQNLKFYMFCLWILKFIIDDVVFQMLQSYIVYLGTHSHGLEPTSADLDRATNSHYNLLSSFVGR